MEEEKKREEELGNGITEDDIHKKRQWKVMWKVEEEEQIDLWLDALSDERGSRGRKEEVEWRMMILWKSTHLSSSLRMYTVGGEMGHLWHVLYNTAEYMQPKNTTAMH